MPQGQGALSPGGADQDPGADLRARIAAGLAWERSAIRSCVGKALMVPTPPPLVTSLAGRITSAVVRGATRTKSQSTA